MKVELLDITQDPLDKIGRYASICYNSKDERTANIKRAIAVKDKGHLACLRFAHATFHVSGISRACSHQFVRSKHLDFLQRSQRYCSEKETEFVYPPNLDEYSKAKLNFAYFSALSDYNTLISHGVKKEDARFVLPEATETELIVTGNLQAWLDFVRLRADKHAQYEIRQVAREINNQLSQHCDGLFNWMP